MNPQEAELQYPLGDQLPALGESLPVAEGIRWIRMRLPFALDHINLWLLRDEIDGRPGWSVIDCCITQDESKAQWETIFATQLEGLPILRVIVTHMHPDHIGLAHWLCERWNCDLWISGTDYFSARVASQGTIGFGGDAAADFFASHGLNDPESVAKVRARGSYYPSMVPRVPARYVRLHEGMRLRIGGHEWRCITGHGHSPEHISLHCKALRVLVSGDMLLPRISTNVSVQDFEPLSNPLTDFLASLAKFLPLPADTLVLPSHGRPFRGIHQRVEQLQSHHRDRLADLMAACRDEGKSAAQMLPVLFTRALDLHQTTFAMGEAIAHLHLLWYEGRMTRTLDTQGVWRFQAVA